MPDRYVNTLMNGGRLPSTDPDKRAINVDLFPGSILESINTYKTFTPDQPADFTGGSVDIRTRTFPDKPSFGTSFTVEYNSQATLNPDFLTYNGGGTGLFGGKANSRQIPQSVINTTTPIPGTLNFNDPAKVASNLEKADKVNSAMRQMSPVIGLTNKAPPPNMSFNLQGGDSIELGQYEKVGVIGAFSYRNKYSYYGNGTRGNLALLATTNPTVFTATNPVSQQMQGKQEVLWGGLTGLSGQWDKDHKASINVMYNRGADDNGTQRSQAPDSPGQPTEYQQIIDYGQRSLSYLQVIGEDVFEEARNFKINWNGGLGQAQLQEPDQRQFTYGLTDSGTYIDLDGTTSEGDATDDTLQRFQRELTENSYYGIVDFTIPMFEEKERTDAFKTGFYQDYSQRDYTQTSFNYPYGFSPTPGLPSQESYTPTNGETWADVFLSPERSGLINPTGALGPYMMSYSIFNQAGDTGANGNNPGTDYQASQGVTASYLMADFKPFPQLTLVGGTRFENTNIKIFGATNLPARYFPDFNGVSKIQQLDLLPAVSATFELTQGVNIRMAWSQTLARPSFKEMGPVITKDFTDDSYFLGNPDLQLSKANNYDFRVEWFPRAGEVLSLSLFYKDLQAPLEQTSFYDPVTELNFFKYQNASSGTIRGLEFEARKRLDQLSSALRQFSLFFNYTYIASSVPITGQTAEFIDQSTRPLQGQPEYVINAGLNYDNDEYRFYAGLFYNVTGPLLYAAGAPVVEDNRVITFFPDIYQQPAPSLDLNITQGLTDNWKLTFRGKNLLNPWFNQTQTLNGTEYIFSSYTRGWDVSLNAAYSF